MYKSLKELQTGVWRPLLKAWLKELFAEFRTQASILYSYSKNFDFK